MSWLKKFNWMGWLALVSLLLIWEMGARGSPKMQLYFPPLSGVIAALGQALSTATMHHHIAVTLARFCAGYLLAALLAVSAGVVLGYIRSLHNLLGTAIELLRPMPSVAIIPVAILLLGIGDSMIVSVTVYASIWPILINTIDGVRRIDATLVNTGRTFGLSQRQILWQIVVPAAAPLIITGLRIGLSIALILVTTAEMIIGSKGLGFYILDEERAMNSANMYAGIIVVALLGYALNRLFLMIEARAIRWRHGMSVREAM